MIFYLTISAIATVSIFLTLLLIRFVRTGLLQSAAVRSLEAEAIILQVHKTGLSINGKLQVRVEVQVQPEKGRSFVTEVIDMMPFIQADNLETGKRIRVRYQTGHYKQVCLLS